MKPILSLLAAAVLLTLGSASAERRGPDYQLGCSLGRSDDGVQIVCPRRVLSGGWPAPFLFDMVGVSVEGKLSFLEDEIRWWPLVATAAFWLHVSILSASIARRLRNVRGGRRPD